MSMLNDTPSLAQLLKVLQQVPYLASKNLYRVANHFLHMDQKKAEQFCQVLLEAKMNIAYCSTCFVWQEKGRPCTFCDATKRNKALVCVVETWQELLAIEKTGGYTGVYHVLGGAICPLEGIGPEDLHIVPLIARVEQLAIQEIILATNQTPEGEATASYIASKLKHLPVTISCLARGIPVGSSIESLDRVTVYKALSERRLF
jgi:recombination protein RecR